MLFFPKTFVWVSSTFLRWICGTDGIQTSGKSKVLLRIDFAAEKNANSVKNVNACKRYIGISVILFHQYLTDLSELLPSAFFKQMVLVIAYILFRLAVRREFDYFIHWTLGSVASSIIFQKTFKKAPEDQKLVACIKWISPLSSIINFRRCRTWSNASISLKPGKLFCEMLLESLKLKNKTFFGLFVTFF